MRYRPYSVSSSLKVASLDPAAYGLTPEQMRMIEQAAQQHVQMEQAINAAEAALPEVASAAPAARTLASNADIAQEAMGNFAKRHKGKLMAAGLIGTGLGLAGQYDSMQRSMSEYGPSAAPASLVGGLVGAGAGARLAGSDVVQRISKGTGGTAGRIMAKLFKLKNPRAAEIVGGEAIAPMMSQLLLSGLGTYAGGRIGAGLYEGTADRGPIDKSMDWLYRNIV